jgi:hypothetical protein
MSVSSTYKKGFTMFHIKRNLPVWERATRIGAGAVAAWAAYAGMTSGIVTMLALATAATLVFTAFIGFCPACWMVGRRFLDEPR